MTNDSSCAGVVANTEHWVCPIDGEPALERFALVASQCIEQLGWYGFIGAKRAEHVFAPTHLGRRLLGWLRALHLDEVSLLSNEHGLVSDFTRSHESIVQPRVANDRDTRHLPVQSRG
ncbi:hypothetical protein WS67_18270 [Burkholderia singularis]|uniref:Uncharacterized protein n=1 Tax=Burkholderia singularis TaxID=1503053 RepID=A0A103DZS9_9BURK|nr:hypothetical protein WS67_18270 [Burkholderia singularis]